MVVFPQPGYTGPEVVTYFRGPYLYVNVSFGELGGQSVSLWLPFQDELQRDKRKTWLIEFYAGWSPPCVHLQPVFAQLSNKYR